MSEEELPSDNDYAMIRLKAYSLCFELIKTLRELNEQDFEILQKQLKELLS